MSDTDWLRADMSADDPGSQGYSRGWMRDMQHAAHKNSVSHGFWDDVPAGDITTYLASKLALIHSEVSETLEELRGTGKIHYLRGDGKPEGIGPELADVVIRVMDLAEYLGIDLVDAVNEKHAYNLTREHKHGKAF